MKLKNKVALVTGASRGLGYIAKICIAHITTRNAAIEGLLNAICPPRQVDVQTA